MRTYEKTHSWLRFSLDLSRALPKLWIMLGECQSKCEHLSRAPLRPQTAKDLHQIYLAKGIQATTAIEGNTLSEEEVLRHIRGELTLSPSKEYLQREIDNILQVCNEVTDMIAHRTAPTLSVERIKHLNAQTLKGLDLSEGVIPGEIRTFSVVVGNVYRGAPAEDCEYLLDRLCDWLNGPDFVPHESLKEYQTIFALLRAIVAHLYLAWIHPFGDGNGRTARLVEFEILMSSGLPTPVTHLTSSHYNRTRIKYYTELDRANKPGNDALSFIEYAVQGFLDGLREYIERVWQQQYDVTWRSYVHETFNKVQKGRVNERRRRLVLDISKSDKPLTRDMILDLTPQLAREYARRKTDRTFTRDLNAVLDMGLIMKEARGYRARKEVILEFLPIRALSKEPSSASI